MLFLNDFQNEFNGGDQFQIPFGALAYFTDIAVIPTYPYTERGRKIKVEPERRDEFCEKYIFHFGES